MDLAIEESKKAFKKNLVPIGSIIVFEDKIIAKAHNNYQNQKSKNVFDHAEFLVLLKCFKKGVDISKCDLYVTLEPCFACATLISQLKLKRLFFGAYSLKTGGIEHGDLKNCFKNTFVVGGIDEKINETIIKNFFKHIRVKK